MAKEILFSGDGIELLIIEQKEERIAKLKMSIGDISIERKLDGKELIDFYRATRYLIRRKNHDSSLPNISLTNSEKENVVKRTIITLLKNKIDVDLLIRTYSSLNPEAENYFHSDLSQSAPRQVNRIQADVFIGIPQNDIRLFDIERIQNATGDFMEAMGFELETQDEPVFGSFYQRLKFLLNGEVKDEASEIYKKGKIALETQFVSVPSAEATGKLAVAAAALITALSEIDEAAIRLGAILVVKISKGGVPMILAETVSPELALLLDKNPHLLKNPNIIFDLISTMRIPEKPIEEGRTEVLD